MRKLVRNIIAWLQGFLPMYQMRIHLTVKSRGKTYEIREGMDWFLPRMKIKVKHWNEGAMAAGCDPAKDHAYYLRIR